MTRRPSALAIDAAFVVLLGAIALIGFHATFSGSDYLIAGGAGLVLGTGLAAIAHKLGQPVIVLSVFTVATFFLVGGAAALHDLGGASWLPVPGTLDTLMHGSVEGWKDLLTTLPPVDGGVLLVIPYLLGLVGGTAGLTVAVRTKSVIWPTLVPIGLMVAIILLGSPRPGEVVANAAAFFLVLLTWVVLRSRRVQIRSAAGNRWRQIAAGVALVVGATALGTLVGPHLPGVSSDRYVLRTSIQPPFDIRQYPSPLASYRRYQPLFVATGAASLAKQKLFHVTGLPGGSFMRIAALDTYDGNVWAASNQSTPAVNGVADTYQRVGTTIGTPAVGPATGPVTVTIDPAYVAGDSQSAAVTTGVWVPTIGQLTGIAFSSPPREQAAAELRYNLATSTGILPSGLETNDTYTFHAVNADEPQITASNAGQYAAWSGSGAVSCPLAQCQSLATTLSGGSPSTLKQILNIAGQLKTLGFLSDGEKGSQQYLAGHSIGRLNGFAQYKQNGMVGDGEQYSALMALLANQVGVPARVVFGAVLPSTCPAAGCDVVGSDIQAWVEVRLSTGWGYLTPSTFTSSQRKLPPQHQEQQKIHSAQPVPAPLPLRPPASATNPLDDQASVYNHRQNHNWWSTLLAVIWWIVRKIVFPIGVILGLCWLIIFSKNRRRRYRRTHGTPVNRLSGAWREYLDRAFDHGYTVPPLATRREQATALALAPVGTLATDADNTMFGRPQPTDEAVDDYWRQIDAAIAAIGTDRKRWQRIAASLNPLSLIPLNWRDRTASAVKSAKRGPR